MIKLLAAYCIKIEDYLWEEFESSVKIMWHVSINYILFNYPLTWISQPINGTLFTDINRLDLLYGYVKNMSYELVQILMD